MSPVTHLHVYFVGAMIIQGTALDSIWQLLGEKQRLAFLMMAGNAETTATSAIGILYRLLEHAKRGIRLTCLTTAHGILIIVLRRLMAIVFCKRRVSMTVAWPR